MRPSSLAVIGSQWLARLGPKKEKGTKQGWRHGGRRVGNGGEGEGGGGSSGHSTLKQARASKPQAYIKRRRRDTNNHPPHQR